MVTFEQIDKKLRRLMLAMVGLMMVDAAAAWGQDASGTGGVAAGQEDGWAVHEVRSGDVDGYG